METSSSVAEDLAVIDKEDHQIIDEEDRTMDIDEIIPKNNFQ